MMTNSKRNACAQLEAMKSRVSDNGSYVDLLNFTRDLVSTTTFAPDCKFVRDVLDYDCSSVNEFLQLVRDGGDCSRFVGQADCNIVRGMIRAHGIVPVGGAAAPSAPFPPPPVAPGSASTGNALFSPMGREKVITIVQTMVGWAIIFAVGWLLVAGLTYVALAGWGLIASSVDGVYSLVASHESHECRRNMSVLEAKFAFLESNVTRLDGRVDFFKDTSEAVVAAMQKVANATLDQIKTDASVVLDEQKEALVEFNVKASDILDEQKKAFSSSNKALDVMVQKAGAKYDNHMKVLAEQSVKMYTGLTETNEKLAEDYSDLDGRLNATNDRLAPLEKNVTTLTRTLPLIVAQADYAQQMATSANLILERTSGGWDHLYMWTTLYFVCVVVITLGLVYVCSEKPADVPFTMLEGSHDMLKAVRNLDKRVVNMESRVKNLETGPCQVSAFLRRGLFGGSSSV